MTSEVYECTVDSIETAKKLIEHGLSITFEPHDSLHWGGDYYLYERGDESFRLFSNCDFEGEPIDAECNDTSKILFQIELTNRGEDYEKSLRSQRVPVRLLRRETVE
jgi:hypothetical protein